MQTTINGITFHVEKVYSGWYRINRWKEGTTLDGKPFATWVRTGTVEQEADGRWRLSRTDTAHGTRAAALRHLALSLEE